MSYRVKIKVEGMVPLLMNRFPMPDSRVTKRQMETKKTQEAELEAKAYKDAQGMYLPADCIRMMLIGNQARIGAAVIMGSQIESKKGKWYKDFCTAFVWVVGPKDPLKVYFGPARKTWDDIDSRSYVGKSGRNLIQRPQINTPWSLEFFVDVFDDQMPPQKLKEIFELGGLRCGLGNYGPTFGRYLVKEFKKV